MNQEILKSKQAVVTKIIDAAKKSQSIVIAEYRGLTVAELTELRRELRKNKASLNVYKNTLVTRAFQELKLDLGTDLTGPNAYVFSEELTGGPSVLLKFGKKHKKLVIKAGMIDGKVATAEEIKTIGSLPNKEGLIAMFLCCLKEPVAKFARTLDAYSKTKKA
ncbi:MAG: 50S ribosomal protein L10 [Bacilli bacterium]|nr:50S ribosomal protein L10 [Bacilli bacterium]MCQ2794442.1 50S ribosomal protein L10 [Bacilli bacterium]